MPPLRLYACLLLQSRFSGIYACVEMVNNFQTMIKIEDCYFPDYRDEFYSLLLDSVRYVISINEYYVKRSSTTHPVRLLQTYIGFDTVNQS